MARVKQEHLDEFDCIGVAPKDAERPGELDKSFEQMNNKFRVLVETLKELSDQMDLMDSLLNKGSILDCKRVLHGFQEILDENVLKARGDLNALTYNFEGFLVEALKRPNTGPPGASMRNGKRLRLSYLPHETRPDDDLTGNLVVENGDEDHAISLRGGKSIAAGSASSGIGRTPIMQQEPDNSIQTTQSQESSKGNTPFTFTSLAKRRPEALGDETHQVQKILARDHGAPTSSGFTDRWELPPPMQLLTPRSLPQAYCDLEGHALHSIASKSTTDQLVGRSTTTRNETISKTSTSPDSHWSQSRSSVRSNHHENDFDERPADGRQYLPSKGRCKEPSCTDDNFRRRDSLSSDAEGAIESALKSFRGKADSSSDTRLLGTKDDADSHVKRSRRTSVSSKDSGVVGRPLGPRFKIKHSSGRTREELDRILMSRREGTKGALFWLATFGRGSMFPKRGERLAQIVLPAYACDNFIESREDNQTVYVFGHSKASRDIVRILGITGDHFPLFFDPEDENERIYYVGHFSPIRSSATIYKPSDKKFYNGRSVSMTIEMKFEFYRQDLHSIIKKSDKR